MTRRRRVSEAQWTRRVLEIATFLAEEALADDFLERLLATLSEDFPAMSAVLDYDAYERRTEVVPWNLDQSGVRAYCDHYHAVNPFAHAIVGYRLIDRTFAGSRWVDQHKYVHSEYYNDFVRPQGQRYFMAMSIGYPDRGRTGIPFYRGEAEGGDFMDEEIRRLDMLRPFIRNALLLRRLSRRESFPNLPIIRNGESTKPQPCNDAGEEWLENRDAGKESERIPYRSLSSGAHIVVPRMPSEPALIFRRRYGLSKRESEVAALLCDGLTYEQVAMQLSISHHTVNGHVKSLLRKLNLTSIRRLPPLLHDNDL